MPDKSARAVQLNHYVEVDYLPGKGLGVGIVQQAECLARNRPIGNDSFPAEEKKIGMKRDRFTAENVKTKERAYMFALFHALSMAHRTAKKDARRKSHNQIEEVKVLNSSPTVVQTLNHHIHNAPTSFEQIRKSNDRVMIEKVVKATKRIFRRGIGVEIAFSDGHDMTVGSARGKAKARAAKLAKQKGGQACRSRREQRERQRYNAEDRVPTGELDDLLDKNKT